jgi:hypothetical protein
MNDQVTRIAALLREAGETHDTVYRLCEEIASGSD